MTLQAAIEAELPFLRAEAEARMVARVDVYRKTGRTAQDEETGREAPEWVKVHSDLPFRLDGGSTGDGGSRGVTVGGVTYEQATAVGHNPADTTDLEDNDFYDITSGEWAGQVYRIVEAVKADQKTASRVPIVEEQRPEEWF